MSYARFAKDSDVYVFWNTGGWLECCHCSLNQPRGVFTAPMLDTPGEMIAHLCEHEAAGHKVPPYAIRALEEDEKEIGK